MTEIQFPPFLQPGDKIGIVAPASVINYHDIKPGISFLKKKWQLQVVEGSTLRTAYNQFSARDAARIEDIQSMLDDPTIKAIIAARGGYGCSRIVDQLNFDGFTAFPKWIIGFSDLTVFLSKVYNLGYASIHAPMVKSMMLDGAEKAVESLRQILFGESPDYIVNSHPLNRMGSVTAEIIGGNLCMLAHMIGSNTDIDTNGKILFIEDVGEYYYNLDRMMIQLKRSGKLTKLAGLVVGRFSDMKDNANPTFGKDVYEIVFEHVSEFDYPVCFNFPVGHVADNRAIGIGMSVFLNVQEEKAELQFIPPATTII